MTDYIKEADEKFYFDAYGSEEELTEDNFYVPAEAEYEDWGEETEEWDVSEAKPGLWENIRRKKEREGKNYKPAKTEKEGRPTQEGSKATLGMLKAVYRRGAGAFSTSHAPKMSRHGWAIARVNAFLKLLRSGRPSNPKYTTDNDLLPKGHPRKSKASFKYKDPKTGQVYEYDRRGIYKKDGRTLVPTQAAEYQGRKVQLGKPFRTPDGPKKRSVYVKNDKGNVVKVNFGDPNMKIKKSDPGRRKNFRARHNCDNPGPRWKARYWSCRAW